MELKPYRLSFTIEEACANTGLARTRMFGAIAEGTLVTFKVGRRRMVTARALGEFIDRLERIGTSREAA